MFLSNLLTGYSSAVLLRFPISGRSPRFTFAPPPPSPLPPTTMPSEVFGLTSSPAPTAGGGGKGHESSWSRGNSIGRTRRCNLERGSRLEDPKPWELSGLASPRGVDGSGDTLPSRLLRSFFFPDKANKPHLLFR